MVARKTIGLAWVIVILSACSGGEQTELREWMQEQTKEMKIGVPPLPEVQALPAVSYEGKDLKVPFSPQKIVTANAVASSPSAQAASERARQPLENFPIEDLTVQGVILTGKRPYALVQPRLPNKPMHVTVGDYMGQNFGKVVSITNTEVTVLETVRDNNGVWTEREIIKPVPRQGGEK